MTLESKIQSVGDRIQPGTYIPHSRFSQVFNFTDGAQLISVVHKKIGAGPVNIVIENLLFDQIDWVEIGRRSIALGQQRYELKTELLYNSELVVEGVNRENFEKNLGLIKELLVSKSPPKSLAFFFDNKKLSYFASKFEKAFVKRAVDSVELIRAGQIILGVQCLKGCGWGLTPSGDDFIAGLLLGLNVRQQMRNLDLAWLISDVYKAARTENILSGAFLRLAKKGRVFERFKKFILAIKYDSERQVQKSALELLSIGATSGADLLTGFLITFELKMFDITEKSQLQFSRQHSSQSTVA